MVARSDLELIVVLAVSLAGMLAAWTAAWPWKPILLRQYSSYLRAMSAHQELQRRLSDALTIEPCLPRTVTKCRQRLDGFMRSSTTVSASWA